MSAIVIKVPPKFLRPMRRAVKYRSARDKYGVNINFFQWIWWGSKWTKINKMLQNLFIKTQILYREFRKFSVISGNLYEGVALHIILLVQSWAAWVLDRKLLHSTSFHGSVRILIPHWSFCLRSFGEKRVGKKEGWKKEGWEKILPEIFRFV